MDAVTDDDFDRSYYTRVPTLNTDGTPLFTSESDIKSQLETARIIGERWNCEVKHFGKLSPVDFYALKHGRMSAVMELKTRPHSTTKYSTVYLNVRKWLSLQSFALSGIPPLFVVRFADGLRWINVYAMPFPLRFAIGGTVQVVKSASDMEPVILVPIANMHEVRDGWR